MSFELWWLALICVGGFCGAIARYKLASFISKRFPSKLPYGTLSVNILGSFALGCMWGVAAIEPVKLGFGTGFLGAFTTFSTIQLDSVKLLRGRGKRNFILYTLFTYVIGIGFAFIGYMVAKQFK
ncbi:fluoride efflux transporter CrcB [Paenibacillus sp. N1-5-1-14]|uniref:fluoride efflux transporter CrcB n=1 Tax=Paenibacillus radicibacter TaxID=2972488 RepID=UPI002159422A|nr:fluoride efflux transporter CrcB [Paenibacillus radicibacter]MCR8641849.1 fluoride efflux transporter CrcB [Paenibacillus radicibacter]